MEKENANGSEAATDASSVHPPNVDAITDVLKTRDWLDGQNYDLAVALKAEKLDLLDTQDVEELQERIVGLQTELYGASAEHAVKELVVKQEQYNHALSNKMFTLPLPSSSISDEAAVSGNGEDGGDRRKYQLFLQEQSKLSSAILRKNEAVSELQKELDAVRKRNFELKKINRGLMGIIDQHSKQLEKTADDVKSNAACRGLKEELESTVSRVEIAKCTLQALIVGSGVNWAQDPDLLETVLLCGDSMQL